MEVAVNKISSISVSGFHFWLLCCDLWPTSLSLASIFKAFQLLIIYVPSNGALNISVRNGMTTKINIKLVRVSVKSHHLPQDPWCHCIVCPFVLSTISTWVITLKSSVTRAWQWRIMCAELPGHLSAWPYLSVSKLSSNKVCYSLRSCLLCFSVGQYLLITVAITPLPHSLTTTILTTLFGGIMGGGFHFLLGAFL